MFGDKMTQIKIVSKDTAEDLECEVNRILHSHPKATVSGLRNDEKGYSCLLTIPTIFGNREVERTITREDMSAMEVKTASYLLEEDFRDGRFQGMVEDQYGMCPSDVAFNHGLLDRYENTPLGDELLIIDAATDYKNAAERRGITLQQLRTTSEITWSILAERHDLPTRPLDYELLGEKIGLTLDEIKVADRRLKHFLNKKE